jgi:hypothetical protein
MEFILSQVKGSVVQDALKECFAEQTMGTTILAENETNGMLN